MQKLPSKFKAKLLEKEAEVREKFGDARYEALIEGRYSLQEFMEVRNYLAKLG